MALYRAGAPAGASAVGAEVDSASFSALTPGTEYEVVVASQAGPLHAAAAPASGWTCEWGSEGPGRGIGGTVGVGGGQCEGSEGPGPPLESGALP